MKPKAIVLGLDGVPHTLLKSLSDNGHVPNLASMFRKGYFGQMGVCIPEISSVSWSSFMTGTQSGEHGIYGFIDLVPGTYNMSFPNFTQLKAATIWDDLASENKKSVVINMPATYPARRMNGALISGFVAIDINKAVYPTTLVSKLQQNNYRIDIDTAKARQDHDFLFRDLKSTLDGREHAVDLLWEEIDWDLFIIVVTGTDRLMHFLWEAYENESHPHHHNFIDYFKKVDMFIGRMFERFLDLDGSEEGNNTFYMISDHGFTGIKSEVYLNRWLQENNFLRFNSDQPKTIMEIGKGSKAFTLDPSRIYVNLKGKYPLGTVDKNDYERILEEIKIGLEELNYHNNGYVAKNVYLKEELYSGPHLDYAPDLVVLSNDGFDLKGKVNSDNVFGRTDLTGMHNQNDAFFFSTSGVQCQSIFETKDIVLDSLKSRT
jgi:predicted AlkP superfamily phosphohydrolase/phosphomutase